MKNTKWYQSLTCLFRTLKPMKWGERLEYIFTYYIEAAFVIGIGVLLVCVLVFHATADKTETIFGGVFANVDINRYGYDYLTEGVLELLDGDPETQKADVSSTFFAQVEEVSQLNYTYNAAMKPMGMLEDGTLDYLVMDENAMMFYMTQYALMDLGEIFSAEELAQMEDKLIYLEMETDHSRAPVAIRVNDIPFFVDCVEVSEPVFFAFTGTREDAQQYHLFWEYLMQWQGIAPEAQ